MFEFIRTHQRLMQFVLLLFIFPSFAFFGLEGYTQFRDRDQAVAKVAGQSITQQELGSAQREQMERFRQMFGQQFDPGMLDTPEARRNILNDLITDRALRVDAANKRLSVSDDALRQTILSIPGTVGADGKFDVERYKSMLASRGMTPAMFESRVRNDLVMQQQYSVVQSTAIAPKTVASRLAELNEQQREIQELLFKPADYLAQVKVTDEMVKGFYDKNGNQFEIPEQVQAQYVVLNSEAVAAQIAVSDADIKAHYDQNSRRYATDEQRRASHILLTVEKGAAADAKAAARARADKLVAQLRQSPGEFARLAKQNSQDPGSAERGGDLDFFSRGMMVKAFEEAAFKLKEGEISEPVESEFGFHIIKVTGIKAATVKALDEVKGEIAAEIRKQLASKKYAEMAEVFTNTVYEQSDSLKSVADKLNLKIETASGLSRKPDPKQPATAAFNQPKFLNALFSDDAIKNKRNTEAVEVAPSTLIAGRVTEYKPVTKRPLEEVQAEVRQRLARTEAAALAKKAGEARLAELASNQSSTGFSAPKLVSRAKNEGIPPAAFSAVMKADMSKLPAFAGTEIPGGGFAVYKINKIVQPPASDPARRQAEHQQIATALAQGESAAYVNALKEKAKVEIMSPALKSPARDGGAGDEKETR